MVRSVRLDTSGSRRRFVAWSLTNDPVFPTALQTLAFIRTRQRRFDDALHCAERLTGIAGRSYVSLSSLGMAYAASGNRQAARGLLQEINLLPHGAYG